MKGRTLVAVASCVALLGISAVRAAESHSCSGHACRATDDNPIVPDPILSRSELAPVPVSLARNGLANANITKFVLRAEHGKITATITMRGPIVHDSDSSSQILPYAGQYIFATFQTPDFERDQIVGRDLAGNSQHWGPPGTNAEGFRWFLGYGWNLGNTYCEIGYVDPYGPVLPMCLFCYEPYFILGGETGLPLVAQDSFASLAGPTTFTYRETISCALSNRDRTVTMTIPYVAGYQDNTGTLQMHVRVISPGEIVSNANALSLSRQDIGGPDPIGYLVGNAYMTDWLPTNSYRRGIVAGSPTKFGLCPPTPAISPIPEYPCVANPFAGGFVNSGLSFVAG